ncbi:outer membrane protein transport protein [Polaribacter batillariae]|uniref:Outer membrane protein transport protein n=1 Tax=Polaribacter batillariae TaxID=2808900 RepID=A0ABX7ST57_9FLAO|nr:outer membrane protein transport protein [Polaribacter batillariae]QTD36844.1 outer membrane protein transport protein [Polaribacter batillariae]
MKKIITLATLFAVTLTSYAQSLNYQELALLFSQDDANGTARFTSMGGAFGALGGDISSININPAGLAVFNNSSFAGTLNSRNTEIQSTFYGNTVNNQDQFFNFSQAGAVLVFESAYKSDWNKFAIGFNYRLSKDFNDNFIIEGNSEVPTFRDFPLDNNNPTIDYNVSDENQRFINNYKGGLDEINLAFSSVYQNRLYVGAGFNFYNLNFSQQSNLLEFNSDGNGNTLDANFYQENFTSGSGISLNAGFIYKANQNFRFGLSYQTPTWFTEIIEDTNIVDNDGFEGDTEITVSNDPNNIYNNTAGDNFLNQSLIYRLKTPSKLTASAAVVFGKSGLFSFDYINRNYSNMKLSNGDFSGENTFFENELKSTNSFNMGAEWRFDKLSVRGGYRFEENPNKAALDSDNISGYSFGAGYNFGNFKVDFAYSNNNRTSFYDVYPQFVAQINTADLSIDNRIFTATVSLSL